MKFLGFTILMLLLTGCTPSLMVKSQSSSAPLNTEGYATIVFIRSSFVASAIGAELYEIEDNVMTLVGGIPNGSKIYHKTKPGEKVYMGHGSAADFMIANVEAGKTYYSIVRPNWGSSGFIPTPIRNNATTDYHTEIPEFKNWISSTSTIEKKPSAQVWFDKNRRKIEQIYYRYWRKFESKTNEEKLERTLNPSDGV